MRALTLLLAALLCVSARSPAHGQYRPDGRTALEKRSALRTWATSQLYVREHGFNRGREVEGYQRGGGGRPGDAWCSWFVSAGFRAVGILTAYFGKARSWFDAAHVVYSHGRTLAGQPAPQPYDLVGYEWGAAHVSHVGYLDLWGSTAVCQTIEGNTSGGKRSREGDGVFKNWRLKSQVAYVANVVERPHYSHGE